MMKFFAYRINLLKQSNLFADAYTQPKEEVFRELIESLERNKSTFVVRNTKFILYYYTELINGVYLLTLAREEVQKIPVEGIVRVEEEPILKTPFVYIIVDCDKQIILIQEKTTVFQDVEVAISRLQYFLSINLGPYYLTPSIVPITDKDEFWDTVSNAEGITEFNITLNSPNLFKGRQRAEDLVEEIHEEFNATEFEIKLKNNFGKLKLLYDNAKDFVSLAAAGAGKYVLKTIKDGVNQVLKSSDYIKKKVYQVDRPEDIDRDLLKQDLEELDKLNDENNK